MYHFEDCKNAQLAVILCFKKYFKTHLSIVLLKFEDF